MITSLQQNTLQLQTKIKLMEKTNESPINVKNQTDDMVKSEEILEKNI